MKILDLKSPIRKQNIFITLKKMAHKVIKVAPSLLNREFYANVPTQRLVTDVSYLYHKNRCLFLSVINNLYDNSILAYQLSRFNNLKLVMDNLADVFTERSYQCLIQSDQGYQYTTALYKDTLESLGVSISHSRKENCYDNACCENFFSHLKSEHLYLKQAKNDQELIEQIDDYITWYNTDRPQSKLKGMTPIEFRNHTF
jgi:Transposase and inactivated derivatives